MPYRPRFSFTSEILADLAVVEQARAVVDLLPLPLAVERRMRQEARVRVAHNSTWIENRTLTLDEARRVIEERAAAAPGRHVQAAATELRNYWSALEFVDRAFDRPLTEDLIRQLHAIIFRGTRGPGRPPVATAYRTRHLQVGRMEYLPPEPHDVAPPMRDLVAWMQDGQGRLPGPVFAAVAAYQFVTIHPFDDGNGRTTRALATLLLRRTGYGLKGLTSMEAFYAADLARYYGSLQMGLHHNYYESNEAGSRGDPDLTPWVSYFVRAFAYAADELRRAVEEQARRRIPLLGHNPLDGLPRQVRRVLAEVPALDEAFTPTDVATWFGVSTKTAREWLSRWCRDGFAEAARPEAQRLRSYRVAVALRRRIRDAGLAE